MSELIVRDEPLANDASQLTDAAGGPVDIGIVLGSGLSAVLRDRFPATTLSYDSLRSLPQASLRGHAGEALVGTWHGKRVCVFAGRVHLYQGFSPQQVTASVRLAHRAGAKLMILTNAAGSVNPQFEPGDLMLIEDHLNLTGQNPLTGCPHENPFVDMHDAYSSRLRALIRSVAKPEYRLREGVYAGLQGPNYETPAEARYLRTIGADAVGMSTVLEAIFARFLRMELAGISLITNMVAAPQTSHAEVTAQGAASAPRLAELLDAFVARL